MYIFYQTQEPVYVGDRISVKISDEDVLDATVGGFHFDEDQKNVLPDKPVLIVQSTTQEGDELKVTSATLFVGQKISWDSVKLHSRTNSEKLFYHDSGDEVRIGDIVAVECGSDAPITHMGIGRIVSFYDPNSGFDKVDWRMGLWVCVLLEGSDCIMTIDPFGGYRATHSDAWEDLYYVRRGNEHENIRFRNAIPH